MGDYKAVGVDEPPVNEYTTWHPSVDEIELRSLIHGQANGAEADAGKGKNVRSPRGCTKISNTTNNNGNKD